MISNAKVNIKVFKVIKWQQMDLYVSFPQHTQHKTKQNKTTSRTN